MRKHIALIILILLFILNLLLLLKYDKQGYYFGLDCIFCKKDIPFKISPKLDRYSVFSLIDEDGFEIIGKGFRYNRTDFTIKDFSAYGYNDTSIMIKCTDSLNNWKYLVSYKTGYNSKKGNLEISFRDLNTNNFKIEKEKYQWIEIDEEKANNIRFMKFLFIIGAFVSLFFIIRKLLMRF